MLFKVDPTPYQLTVNSLQAQLIGAEGGASQLREQLEAAVGNTAAIRARTRSRSASVWSRTASSRRPAPATGSISSRRRRTSRTSRPSCSTAIANEAQVQAQLAAVVDGDIASIAKIKADLANAQWELDSRRRCVAVRVLRHQPAVASRRASWPACPFNPVMTLVEADGQVVALFYQNELHQIAPGNEAEFTLLTYPGRIIKAKVDSVIWAQGVGPDSRRAASMPMTGVLAAPPSRFAVKFDVDRQGSRAASSPPARRAARRSTRRACAAIHIMRKVILRVGAYTDYLILKLH